jgi:urease alpha subunit
MAYDLLIRGGRVVDGSGLPSFVADVGVKNGKIAEIGRLKDSAARPSMRRGWSSRRASSIITRTWMGKSSGTPTAPASRSMA